MKLFIVLSFMFIFMFCSVSIAGDHNIVYAGDDNIPMDYFITETPVEYIDFYQRRFAYKKQRDQVRDNIDKRRHHYNAARSKALQDYKNSSDAFYISD